MFIFKLSGDYYGLAVVLAVIIIHSEPFPYGILWTLAFCLVGSQFACFWIVYRLLYKSVKLNETGYIKIPNLE